MREGKYIEIQDLCKWYPVRKSTIRFGRTPSFIKAVDGICLGMEQGEILGVIGESGCGKSTLGRTLTALEPPTQGDIFIDGVSTAQLLQEDAKKFHRLVQMIFQNPYDTFTPRDTIEKILLRTLKIHRIGNSLEERRRICVEALEKGALHPAEDFLSRYPYQLSGGQLQRISILRAMLLEPKFVIADEPVSMLDVSVRADIINMLLDLRQKSQATIVFISHDIGLTRYISDKIAVMYLGKVVEYALADQIIQHPLHPYTKVLLSNCPSIDPLEKTKKIAIQGEPPTPVDPKPGCAFAPRCYQAEERCFCQDPPLLQIRPDHVAACTLLKGS